MFFMIQSVLTPAVMINVCALLLLSTANRNSRIIDRIRHLTSIFLEKHQVLSPDVMENYGKQMICFQMRSRLLRSALLFNYIALLSFVLSSISLFLTHVSRFGAVLPVFFIISGFVCLSMYCYFMLREMQVHFQTTQLDIQLAESFLKT